MSECIDLAQKISDCFFFSSCIQASVKSRPFTWTPWYFSFPYIYVFARALIINLSAYSQFAEFWNSSSESLLSIYYPPSFEPLTDWHVQGSNSRMKTKKHFYRHPRHTAYFATILVAPDSSFSQRALADLPKETSGASVLSTTMVTSAQISNVTKNRSTAG